jgi:predicted NBD/HSP70 family sugar kinase
MQKMVGFDPKSLTGKPALTLLSPKDIGHRNRASLITALYDHGPMSRAQLARLLKTSRSTITTIVKPLISQNILEEIGTLENSTVTGKPGTLLGFSKKGPTIIGISILPQEITFAQLKIDGTILRIKTFKTPATSKNKNFVTRILQKEIPKYFTDSNKILGIGVSVGGIVNSYTGEIIKMALAPHLNGLNVKEILRESFGKIVIVDHHPRSQALGERWFGYGRNKTNFITCYISDTVGTGIYLNGILHSGPLGAGGEFGHTYYPNSKKDILCSCGLKGCWEISANFTGFHKGLKLLCNDLEKNNFEDLTNVMDKNKEIKNYVEDYAELIAIGIANLQNLLAPGLFIILGEITILGEPFLSLLRKFTRKHMLETLENKIELIFAAPEEHFAILGAASLALAKSLHFPV